MSSIMTMSLSSLREILTSTKSLIESNDALKQFFGYGAKSLSFAKEHKIEVAGVTAAGLIAWYLTKVWYAQRTFKRMGIKTPEYKFFYGHFQEILDKSYSEALKDWTAKYGKIYGIYEGHVPVLVTADADMAQEILIKQFSNFSARRKFPYSFEDDDPKISLFFAGKGRWRRHRTIINQTFTTTRLKELYGFIKLCSDRFMQLIDQHTGKDIESLIYLRRYTMDVIWNCAFGVDIDCQNHPESKFYKKGVDVFEVGARPQWSFLLTTYFHEFRSYVMAFTFIMTFFLQKFTEYKPLIDSFSWLGLNIGSTFEKRFALKTVRKDFINILLETHDEKNNDEQDKMSSKELEAARMEKKMTLEEIKYNMVALMIAGFETTSSTLNMTFYMMAKYPEELKKLQAEVDSHFKNNESAIDFDSLSQLEYLEMFIKEVLRFFPIANNVVARRCTNPCTINGIYIPDDFTVAIDCKTLHFDPEHWGPDANEFNPSRFSPEIKRHPAAYLPFGAGPRTCIGMRFAFLEMKLTLAKFLLKYDVVATSETRENLKFTEFMSVMINKTPVIVRINPRQE